VISDAMWEQLEPLLPSMGPRRGGRWRDHRLVIEAIAWKCRTGAPWRDLPDAFGPWQSAYTRFLCLRSAAAATSAQVAFGALALAA
jgi:transposase